MGQFQILLIKPRLDIGLFVDLAEFSCFYQFLHDVIIKLFCFDLGNRLYQNKSVIIKPLNRNKASFLMIKKFHLSLNMMSS